MPLLGSPLRFEVTARSNKHNLRLKKIAVPLPPRLLNVGLIYWSRFTSLAATEISGRLEAKEKRPKPKSLETTDFLDESYWPREN